jgi:hypothetical protein
MVTEPMIIQKEKRNGGIELLRIVLMLQIIYLHVCQDVQGGYATMAHSLSQYDYAFYVLTWIMSRTPIYLFVIITGYFSVEKINELKDVKKKVFSLWRQMFFYAAALPVAGILLKLWTIEDVIIPKIFFPVLSRTWYFLTLYVLVLVFSPYINRCIRALSHKEYLSLLGILFFIFSIWQPLSMISPFNTFLGIGQVISTEGGKSLYGFVFMYILGGYIKRYMKPTGKLQWGYLVTFILLGLISFTLFIFFPQYQHVAGYNDNLFAVLQAVCLFVFFRSINFYSKIINTIASMTLAVYMIHQYYLFRPILWNDIFGFLKTPQFYDTFYPLKIIGVVVSIFIGGIMIEAVRKVVVWSIIKLSALTMKNLGRRK